MKNQAFRVRSNEGQSSRKADWYLFHLEMENPPDGVQKKWSTHGARWCPIVS